MADVGIKVEGLTEVRKALHDIDPNLQKALRVRFRVIAQKVADRARSKMPSRTGKARSAVRAGATASTAYVATGKASVPYTPWLDFGGVLKPVGKRHNTQVRPRIKDGRYLYPAIHELQPQLENEAAEALNKTAADVGLN